MSLGLCVVGGVLAPLLVRFLYGQEFLPAVPALLWLLPAVWALSVNTVFKNYFAAEGMPLVAIVSPGLAAALNVVLNLFWIPWLGIIGASLASVAAYGLMLTLSLVYLWRRRIRDGFGDKLDPSGAQLGEPHPGSVERLGNDAVADLGESNREEE